MMSKVNFPWSFLAFILFSSCSSGPTSKKTTATTQEDGLSCGKIELTYNYAEVQNRPNGGPWDNAAKTEDGFDQLLVTGLLLLLAIPPQAATIAGKMSTQKSASDASTAEPDVFVAIVGKREVFRSPVMMNQSFPNWRYTAIVDTDLLEEQVDLVVSDADPNGSKDTIGVLTIPKKRLCTSGSIEFKNFGSVKQVVLKSAPYVSKPVKTTLSVPANMRYTNTKVHVLQGMDIVISAEGRVCANQSRCTGPEGFALPEWQNYNVISNERHCSLIMYILPENETNLRADLGPFPVGKGQRFKAQATGSILLGPNDTDERNNHGQYDVTIDVR